MANDTTKVQVLDVPGFFGDTSPTLTIEESLRYIGNESLCIMHKFLRIQTANELMQSYNQTSR